MLVQALVPQAPVERFDVGILVGFARLDQEQPHATRMRPGQRRPAAELLAVVGADRLRQSTLYGQPVEDACQGMAADGTLGNDGDRLVRGVAPHLRWAQVPQRRVDAAAEHDIAEQGQCQHGVYLSARSWPDPRRGGNLASSPGVRTRPGG